MKKVTLLLILVAQVFWAQNNFENGNKLYQQGQYEAAAEAYQSVLNGRQESAELYFNLANCYYKRNKVAPAIYNYEKALTLRPGDAEILNNLHFAQKMTIDEIKEVPKVGFAKLLRDFTAMLSYDGWAWMGVGFSTLFLLFFVGYYFSSLTIYKRIFFVGMFVLIFLILLSLLSAVFEKSHDQNERPAIVFAESAEVKSEPRTAGSDVVVLHEGTKVMVLETLDDWKKVELLDGSEGWILSNVIKEVKL